MVRREYVSSPLKVLQGGSTSLIANQVTQRSSMVSRDFTIKKSKFDGISVPEVIFATNRECFEVNMVGYVKGCRSGECTKFGQDEGNSI